MSTLRLSACLWLNDCAEQAAKFYLEIFPNSRVTRVARYTSAGVELHGKPVGSVMSIEITLDGSPFTLLNGGPVFQISEAVSFEVRCETQAQVDYYWQRLSEGGAVQPCGWVKDQFGVSWQVTPTILSSYVGDSDPVKAERVLKSMFSMTKLIIADLQRAYESAS